MAKAHAVRDRAAQVHVGPSGRLKKVHRRARVEGTAGSWKGAAPDERRGAKLGLGAAGMAAGMAARARARSAERSAASRSAAREGAARR